MEQISAPPAAAQTPNRSPSPLAPYAPTHAPFSDNGFGTAGMVIGIVSTVLSLISSLFGVTSLSYFALKVICIDLSVWGIPLSIIGRCRRLCPKGKAIAGLILNAFGLYVAILGFLAYGAWIIDMFG